MIKKIDIVNVESLIRKHKMISMNLVSENYTEYELDILNILEKYDITKLKSYIRGDLIREFYMDEYGIIVFSMRQDFSLSINVDYIISHFNKHLISLNNSHIYKFRNLKGGLDKIIKKWISYYYGFEFDVIDYYTYSYSKCLSIEKTYLI